VRLRIGRRAQEQAARIGHWWAGHREKAPDLFVDELEATFRFLCRERSAGVRWPTPRRPAMRRILMPRTQNHVYFVVDEAADAVHVLAIWGAPRGKTPKL
jgi:plasmid stabilization system protein ParE